MENSELAIAVSEMPVDWAWAVMRLRARWMLRQLKRAADFKAESAWATGRHSSQSGPGSEEKAIISGAQHGPSKKRDAKRTQKKPASFAEHNNKKTAKFYAGLEKITIKPLKKWNFCKNRKT